MATPHNAPYKVEQRELRHRLRQATLVGYGSLGKLSTSREAPRGRQPHPRHRSFGQGLINVQTRRQKEAIELARKREMRSKGGV